MTIIQILNRFVEKKLNFKPLYKTGKTKIINLNSFLIIGVSVLITIIFFSISNYITSKNLENRDNLKNLSKNK